MYTKAVIYTVVKVGGGIGQDPATEVTHLRLNQPPVFSSVVLSVSSLPLSVMVRSCHACVKLSRLRSSGFTLTLHSGSSPSPTRQWAGHIACTKLPEDVI